MKQAEFTLERIFYPEFSMNANPDFKLHSDIDPAQPSFKVRLFDNKGGRYVVYLELEKPIESESDAYEIRALSVGRFQTSPETPSETQQAIIMHSAPNILYGALREHIISMTSRGPWSEYYLPAVIIDPEDFATDEYVIDEN